MHLVLLVQQRSDSVTFVTSQNACLLKSELYLEITVSLDSASSLCVWRCIPFTQMQGVQMQGKDNLHYVSLRSRC